MAEECFRPRSMAKDEAKSKLGKDKVSVIKKSKVRIFDFRYLGSESGKSKNWM